MNNELLPWAELAIEFRDNMPEELQAFIDKKAAAASDTDHSKSIRERLKSLLDLFKVSRYRPNPTGSHFIDDEQSVRGGQSQKRSATNGNGGGDASGKRGGVAGNIYTLFEKKDGKPGEKVTPDPFPDVIWVSLREGTRDPGVIEDRAARFLKDQNKLLINGDFRAFTDMINKWHQELGSKPALEQTIIEVVRGWFEQALTETVIGVQALQNSKEWTIDDINKALSEEALTGAVMQRYHVHNNVKRELMSKLGKHQLV